MISKKKSSGWKSMAYSWILSVSIFVHSNFINLWYVRNGLQQKLDIDIEAEAAISNQNESNEPSKCDTIYANVFHQNEIKNEHINVSNHSVPVGRKPALPPKPPNALRLSLLKPKGYSCITENRNGKTSKIRIDPAELSMKERLALFEKHKDSVLVPEALSNKTHSKKMSVPVKSINVKRKSLYSPHVPHTSNLMKTIHQQKTIICGN